MKATTFYLMGVRLLDDLRYDTEYSDEERAAIDKTKDVLARLYAKTCLEDIDGIDGDSHLEFFCEETVERIDAYNNGAEMGVKEFLAKADIYNQKQHEESI